MNIMEKILTPVLSSIALALILSFGSEYFLSIIMYSLPVFLIGGTLFSFAVDNILEMVKLKKRYYNYLISFILYGIGGVIIITIFALFQGSISEVSLTPLLVLGVLPGLIYFHLSLILNTLISKI
ncbi:hypothetical protein [Oceanobacillus saliphilus]|uniref:hypothetical protein n=1 Tax=Oceanobacillus saliphilus TaxID=2925834 RepID=UPI00201E3817|nr:hypothetical protein [Oceanobacillus saliphilus]